MVGNSAVESSYYDTPLKALPDGRFATKTAAPSILNSEEVPKLNKALDKNKLVEVHLANSSVAQSTLEPTIEFTVSNANLNLSIKNLNLGTSSKLPTLFL